MDIIDNDLISATLTNLNSADIIMTLKCPTCNHTVKMSMDEWSIGYWGVVHCRKTYKTHGKLKVDEMTIPY